MGFGFIVSGVAKQCPIPPFASLITLPQFLLGTFFSVDAFSFLAFSRSQGTAAHAPEYRYAQCGVEGPNLWDVKS